jgi:hypothetical protein
MSGMDFPAEQAETSEQTVLREMVSGALTSSYYKSCEISRVFCVHDGVCAVALLVDELEEEERIMFFSTKNMKCLRSLSTLGAVRPSSLVFGAGEMWILENQMQYIMYYGPSDETTSIVCSLSERVDHAFSVFCNGDIACAVTILQEELKCGLDVVCGLKNWSLLDYAVNMKNVTAIRFLIDRGVSARTMSSAVGLAVSMGHAQLVSLLIDLGADINATYPFGMLKMSLLSSAVYEGRSEIVSLLVSRNADVDHGHDSYCPLWFAGMYIHKIPAVVETLCASGADVNARNAAGETVLFRWIADAMGDGLENILPVICKYGCDLDAVCGPDKCTSLMLAVSRFWLGNVEILVGLGADVSINNIDGKTALDMLEDAIVSDDGTKTRYNWRCRDNTMVTEYDSAEIRKARLLLAK